MLWTDKDKPITGKETTTTSTDWVQVVRCKDCRYYWKNGKHKSNLEFMEDVLTCLASPSDDAFCSEGKRIVRVTDKVTDKVTVRKDEGTEDTGCDKHGRTV